MPRKPPVYARTRPLVAFGAAIRQARAEAGISQEELAFRADVGRAYMSKLEQGTQAAGLITMIRIASALGTSVSQLMLDAGL
jgi:transcriptional regulator with XRE-family HTH domain